VNLRLFTGVWGKYIDTFELACAQSLEWPSNKEAIKGSTWNIVCEPKHEERVNAIRARCGVFRGQNIFLHNAQDFTHQFSGHLYEEMKKCVAENAVFLFCLPDYVFGDGTVQNLKALMTEPGLCLAVPNTRVLPSAMEAFKHRRTNAELVTIAFDRGYMHQTWRDAELGKDKINSFYGGVHWQEVAPDIITVMHRLPSSYMCSFLASDIEFFKTQSSFSAWDHTWPSKLLKEGRQRFIGSSDVAFITEVTDPDKNQALTLPISLEGPSAFYRSLPHHEINKNIMTVFRKG
jgi:hypothetical protein